MSLSLDRRRRIAPALVGTNRAQAVGACSSLPRLLAAEHHDVGRTRTAANRNCTGSCSCARALVFLLRDLGADLRTRTTARPFLRSSPRTRYHPTMRVDEGHKALDALARTYGQLNLADANEAETRLKVIDQVLLAVLGWCKEDLAVEERVSEDGSTTFADYVVRTAATAFLVEAKRVGAAFCLPAKNTRLKLGGVLKEGEVGDAIRQARDYGRKKAIPFAVVTNGNTWIAFPAVRTDQVPFEESDTRIFRSLDDIKTRFVEFWELLSRERVLDGNLENELIGGRGPDATNHVLRQLLPEPGYRLGRNSLYEHIEPAVAQALSDEALLENADALAACYVKTTERLKFDNRLQMHLRDPAPQLGHQTVRLKTRKNIGRVEERITSTGPSATPRFIVLLGPVGAGKTTFLHYTRKVSAANAIDGKIVWLMSDFKKATTFDNPRTFILGELLAAIESDEEFSLGDWNQTIRSAYAPQIDALRRGPLYLLSKNSTPNLKRRSPSRSDANEKASSHTLRRF
jgi:hypothetical protein